MNYIKQNFVNGMVLTADLLNHMEEGITAANSDLSDYYTKPQSDEKFQPKGDYLTEVPEGYAKTEDIPAKPEDIGAQPAGNYLTEVPSDYATKEFVTNKIAEAELGGEEVDLSGYAQKSELPTKVSQLQNDAGYLTAVPDGYAKTADIPTKPSDIGADPAGTAASAVSQHNTDADAHNDLRIALQGLSDRINAALDSDDATLDQMSEVVAYIKSNKSLIDAITTSKINVSDIIDNLTTNVSNKPLSSAQGVVLKGLIETVSNSLSGYQPKGDYALKSEIPDISGKLDSSALPTAINTALAQAKASGEFDGANGKTPVKGTDYYTEADKTEMVSRVLSALPTWNGGSY